MATTIHPNASTILNFIENIQTTLIESDCFDIEYLEEQFPEVSIIGLLHLSDGELNEMFEFKSPKFYDEKNEYNYYKYWGYDENYDMTKMSKKQKKMITEMVRSEEVNKAIEFLWNKTNLCEDMMGEIVSFI